MLKKLIKLVPNPILVRLYKLFPIKSIKDWFVHQAQQKFLVGIIGIILNENGEVLLLHHDYRKTKWGLPSGWLEAEQPMDGLKREIFEECGFNVELSSIFKTNYYKNPTCIDIIFIGKWIGGSFKPSEEISSYNFYKFDELPDDLPSSQKQLLKEYSKNL